MKFTVCLLVFLALTTATGQVSSAANGEQRSDKAAIANNQKLHGWVQFPDTPAPSLDTYCNIHGPSASSPEFAAIVAETNADAGLKQRWRNWSAKIVDELNSRWSAIATVEGDCDVCSIRVRNRHVEVGPDDFFPHNKLIVAQVNECLHTLEGKDLLDLPRGTRVKSVTIFASFAAGPGALHFDWKPSLPEAMLLGRTCLPGARNHESIAISSPAASVADAATVPLPLSIFKRLRQVLK